MTAIAPATRHALIDDEMREAGPDIFQFYLDLIAAGSTPVMAHMLASRRGPEARNTDKSFCSGAQRRMSTMNQDMRKEMLKRAHKAGVKTEGKYFVGGLGRYEDQKAWVSGADDVLRVAKERNLNVEGVINHKAQKLDQPPPKKRMAEDVMQARLAKYAQDPQVAEKLKKGGKKALGDLKQKIAAVHGKCG